MIWGGLETVFGDLRAFSGFPEKAKTLSVGPKVDLELSGDRFRGPQSIFRISSKGENALWAPKLIWSGLETVFGYLSIFGISRKGENALCEP